MNNWGYSSILNNSTRTGCLTRCFASSCHEAVTRGRQLCLQITLIIVAYTKLEVDEGFIMCRHEHVRKLKQHRVNYKQLLIQASQNGGFFRIIDALYRGQNQPLLLSALYLSSYLQCCLSTKIVLLRVAEFRRYRHTIFSINLNDQNDFETTVSKPEIIELQHSTVRRWRGREIYQTPLWSCSILRVVELSWEKVCYLE